MQFYLKIVETQHKTLTLPIFVLLQIIGLHHFYHFGQLLLKISRVVFGEPKPSQQVVEYNPGCRLGLIPQIENILELVLHYVLLVL